MTVPDIDRLPPPPNAAIQFEPDGFLLDGPRLMGRQAAGNAFLRAAIAGRGDQPMFAYTANPQSAEIFRQVVAAQDPQADIRWIPADRIDVLAEVGTLYLPDPSLASAARLRLRAGIDAYSLVGVTHTTASHSAMDAIVSLLSAPVMPWDALICTSTAVANTVKAVLDAEIETLQWRFGEGLRLTAPQLPVIPLGVHCDDFQFSPEERRKARAELGLADDEVVGLFVGRLSYHAKAHPHAMYSGLEAASKRSGNKVALVQCGWFANDSIKAAFEGGARDFCPSVKAIFTDGKDAAARRRSWAAADFFISLSDNIQETFGLTPIEAMAAGLPTVVSDWDGYRDTVRDGEDGFRIPTWMPISPLGEPFARELEAGTLNYDYYCGLTCQAVSVDAQILVDRLTDVIGNAELRARLGAAARERARQVFDWSVIYAHYRALYARLGELRIEAKMNPAWQAHIAAAPKSSADRLDPFRSFAHYPTRQLDPTTVVAAVHGASRSKYEALVGHDLFHYARRMMPDGAGAEGLLALLAQGPLTLQELADQSGNPMAPVMLAISTMGKMGLVRFVLSV